MAKLSKNSPIITVSHKTLKLLKQFRNYWHFPSCRSAHTSAHEKAKVSTGRRGNVVEWTFQHTLKSYVRSTIFVLGFIFADVNWILYYRNEHCHFSLLVCSFFLRSKEQSWPWLTNIDSIFVSHNFTFNCCFFLVWLYLPSTICLCLYLILTSFCWMIANTLCHILLHW